MDRRWDQAMAQAADFVAGHGRLPKRHNGDTDEERLAQWLRYMRSLHGRGLLRPGRAGRLPQRSKNATEHEWSLASFINRQRRRIRNDTLPAHRAAQLDAAVPGWNTKPESHQGRRVREHHAAAWERVAPHGPVILADLASGRSPAQMARMTGVPHQLLFGLARHNTEWAGQLEEALIQGRNPATEHGTHAAYRHGCRCRQCRYLIAGYRQRSQRR